MFGDREPEAGARTSGGEIRIEDATEVIACNARALIAELDPDPTGPQLPGAQPDWVPLFEGPGRAATASRAFSGC